VTLLGLVVVLVDLETETHLFDLGVGLVATRLARLDRRFVLELAVVHELDDGRTRVRGHLDQIEIGFLSKPHGILNPDDAYLLALRAYQSDLGDSDAFVDAGLVDNRSFVVVNVLPTRKKAPAGTRAEATKGRDERERPSRPNPGPLMRP